MSGPRKCPDCPVDADLGPCRGESIPHRCKDAGFRAYFLRRAREGAPSSPAYLTCPHARPLTRARNCRDRICDAKGGIIVCVASDCRSCPIPAGRLLPAPIESADIPGHRATSPDTPDSPVRQKENKSSTATK